MTILNGVFIALLPVLFTSNMENRTMHKTYVIDGKQVTCTIEEFVPAIVFKNDVSKLNQSTAVQCSHLFYSCLAKGDLDAAAKLSNDPAKVREKYLRQKERAGDKEFKKMYADYFAKKAMLKYHFSLGKSHMLIVHSEDMGIDMAQFYVDDANKVVVDERGSADKDLLGKIFQLLKDEDGNVIVK
jgi:hypothetical protein